MAGYTRASRRLPGESPADVRRRVLAYGDDRTFADWLGPLPGDAAALFRATVTRSTAELDEISFGHGAGYFALVWSSGGGLSQNVLGGSSRLIEALAAGVPGGVRPGGRHQISLDGDEVRVRYREDGSEREAAARHVVVATKAFDAARIIKDLPPDTRRSLDAIPYSHGCHGDHDVRT